LTNPRKAGYGGLIRKYDENFQLGFFGCVGISNILHAEIQALLTSIKLCWGAGYRKLVCYSDSLHVVHLVMKETTTRLHHYVNLLELIRMYLTKDWSISIKSYSSRGEFLC
jgi:ribonuclease HI